MYFISSQDQRKDRQKLEELLSPVLVGAIGEYCQEEVWGIICNVSMQSEQFDLNMYFGGSDMPQYALVYKIFLKDAASVTAFRKSQQVFQQHTEVQKFVDLHKSFVLFTKEVLALDVPLAVRVSALAASICHYFLTLTASSLLPVNRCFTTYQDHLI